MSPFQNHGGRSPYAGSSYASGAGRLLEARSLCTCASTSQPLVCEREACEETWRDEETDAYGEGYDDEAGVSTAPLPEPYHGEAGEEPRGASECVTEGFPEDELRECAGALPDGAEADASVIAIRRSSASTSGCCSN